jgi:hypothetical protein
MADFYVDLDYIYAFINFPILFSFISFYPTQGHPN